ncbi:hypothetical protein KEM48_012926 [Puccinia striiformis f. sp. tritici PST-130]|nr:hypothetical protein KEM48_012926 [Puccinia striiformis f. sp. tritici PST-130]
MSTATNQEPPPPRPILIDFEADSPSSTAQLNLDSESLRIPSKEEARGTPTTNRLSEDSQDDGAGVRSVPVTRSQSALPALQINTRNRATSWSIFRRNSISTDRPESLPTNLLSRLTTPSQPSPPPSAPPSGSGQGVPPKFRQTHHSTGSGSFSLSSLASALKRPLNLSSASTSPAPSTPTPSQPRFLPVPESPSDTRSTHELSSKDADPDPTPSVPPRLVIDSPSSSQEDEEIAQVPFDFNLFLEQMRWPQAEPIAKYLRSFLKEFTKRSNHPTQKTGVAEQVKVVNDFLDFISIKMREIPDGPWDPRTCNEVEFDNAVEAMEKLVMNRVWHLTFTPVLSTPQPSQTDDIERDTVLTQKMNLFSWVTDRHLDLSLPEDEADGFLEFAKTELLKINSYKAPRDKLICILNCCKVIFGLIRHVDHSEGGADTFIPILILVVLRAQPKTLISNLQYIQRFRNPDKMQGENGYYMSSLNAAISFIERLEHSVLSNITQEEFEFNVEQAIVRLPRSPVLETNRTGQLIFPSISMNNGAMGKEQQGEGQGHTEEGSRAGLVSGMMSTSTSLPDLTRSWLFTTVPQLAEKAVSKPLNAIARIVDDLASESDEIRSVPDTNNNHPTLTRRASSSNNPPHSPVAPSFISTSNNSIDHTRRGSRRNGRPQSADSPGSSRYTDLPSSSSELLGTPSRRPNSSSHHNEKSSSPHSGAGSSTHRAVLDEEDYRRIEALKRAEHALNSKRWPLSSLNSSRNCWKSSLSLIMVLSVKLSILYSKCQIKSNMYT